MRDRSIGRSVGRSRKNDRFFFFSQFSFGRECFLRLFFFVFYRHYYKYRATRTRPSRNNRWPDFKSKTFLFNFILIFSLKIIFLSHVDRSDCFANVKGPLGKREDDFRVSRHVLPSPRVSRETICFLFRNTFIKKKTSTNIVPHTSHNALHKYVNLY